MSKPILSVVIVSWNVSDLLKSCLDSIFTTSQDVVFEVIVVDNNSSDGTVKMVEREFPQVKLIANSTNNGFSKACHQGANEAAGDYFLFLNDDTQIFDHTFDRSLTHLAKAKTGVLGCRVLNSDNSQQQSVRRFPSFYSLVVLLTKLHNIFPFLLSKYLYINFDYNKIQEVDQVMGAFFLTPKTLWDKLGGFDTKFYIWFEEVDYCLRAKQASFSIIYYSDTRIKHSGGASFKQLKALPEQLIFNNSLLHFARKHLLKWQVVILYLLIPVNIFLTLMVVLLDKLNINPKP